MRKRLERAGWAISTNNFWVLVKIILRFICATSTSFFKSFDMIGLFAMCFSSTLSSHHHTSHSFHTPTCRCGTTQAISVFSALEKAYGIFHDTTCLVVGNDTQASYCSSGSALHTIQATTAAALSAAAVHSAPASPTELCAHSPPNMAPTNRSTGAAILLFLSTFFSENRLGSEKRSQ